MNLSQARAAADLIETVNAKRRPMPTYDDWKCAAPGEHPLAKEAVQSSITAPAYRKTIMGIQPKAK